MARAFLAFLACLWWADAAAAQTSFVGGGASIARGADGLGLISYYDAIDLDLKVAHCSNALCTSAVVTRLDGMNGDDVGRTTAIAVGSDGLGLIAYYDVSHRDLKVAHCTNVLCTSATITRLDTAGQAGANPSLAIGADGLALIAYDSEVPPTSGAVRVAHCADVVCSSALISTVDSGWLGGLTIGSDGRGLISYDYGQLSVAHCTDVSCTTTTRTQLGDGAAMRVAVGTDGLGLIAYRTSRFSVGDFGVAHCADVLCTSATLTSLDELHFETPQTGLALGSDGLGLISYVDMSSARLKVAHCSDAGCTAASTHMLDTSRTGGSSVAVGGDGLGLVAYAESQHGYLKVAHCSDAACTTATLSILDGLPPDPELVPGPLSLANGADGFGLLSYWDAIARDLKVAHCSNLDCSHATLTHLDGEGDVGQYSSLAVGADGLGLISYYDASNGDLKVAHCADVLCTAATLTTLDSAGNVGTDTSLAIGTDGLGLIAYHDVTNGHLKVAHCSNTACTAATLSTVDAAAVAGRDTNLEIGGDGLGLIAYQGSGSNFVAHCQDVACTSATRFARGSGDPSLMIGSDGLGLVGYFFTLRFDQIGYLLHCANAQCSSTDSASFVGGMDQISSAKGSDGLPLLSYQNVYSFDLEVAHCTDPTCSQLTRATLDTAGLVGMFGSLTIGSDGFGLIAYWDGTEGRLKVAHCADVPCSSARISVLAAATRFYTLNACRVADTRPSAAPLQANVTRSFAVGGGTCGVPMDALAAAVNAVAVNPSEPGNLRMYATGQPEPMASVLNFAAGRTRANNGVVALGRDGQVDVRCELPAGSTGQTHFVLDVFGYFK